MREIRQAVIRPEHGILLVTIAFKESERDVFWIKEFSLRSGRSSFKALSLMGPEGLLDKQEKIAVVNAEPYRFAIPAPAPNTSAELWFADRKIAILPRPDRSKPWAGPDNRDRN